MVALYVVVSPVNREWLETRRTEDHASFREILDALIDEARKDGCVFRGRPLEVVRP